MVLGKLGPSAIFPSNQRGVLGDLGALPGRETLRPCFAPLETAQPSQGHSSGVLALDVRHGLATHSLGYDSRRKLV